MAVYSVHIHIKDYVDDFLVGDCNSQGEAEFDAELFGEEKLSDWFSRNFDKLVTVKLIPGAKEEDFEMNDNYETK